MNVHTFTTFFNNDRTLNILWLVLEVSLIVNILTAPGSPAYIASLSVGVATVVASIVRLVYCLSVRRKNENATAKRGRTAVDKALTTICMVLAVIWFGLVIFFIIRSI